MRISTADSENESVDIHFFQVIRYLVVLIKHCVAFEQKRHFHLFLVEFETVPAALFFTRFDPMIVGLMRFAA